MELIAQGDLSVTETMSISTKPKITRPVSMLGTRMQPSSDMGSGLGLHTHVVSAHPECPNGLRVFPLLACWCSHAEPLGLRSTVSACGYQHPRRRANSW